MNPILNLRKHPRLALLFTALLVIFCRSPERDASWFGPGCIVYNNITLGPTLGSMSFSSDKYSCPMVCADGSTVVVNGNDRSTYEQLVQRAQEKCPAATATPTATAEPPQATATPTATAAPAQPLTGEVTACNLIDGFINFKLASTVSNPQITFNGYPVKCEVPSSNPDVLSCIVPQGQNFPMEVKVQVDGQLIDSFTFDGSGCIQFSPTKANPPQDPPTDGEPLCTGVPPYPEGCTPP